VRLDPELAFWRAYESEPTLKDRSMSLLQSICCLFGSRCAAEEPRSTKTAMGDEPPVPADLGQKEAELEKTGKEQMSHMEGGDASEQQPPGRSPRKPGL
jgi:hypothetical protein